eukprot:4415_1
MNGYALLSVVWLSSAYGFEMMESVLQWRDINISLPKPTAHQVIGYYPDTDRVYLLGGDNVDNEYWSLQFNESYNGWSRNEKLRFEELKIVEYTQSYLSSVHNIIYIKTHEYIHIFDMEIDYFNENVIELPIHLSDGCMTVYYDEEDPNIEYLILVGSKTRANDGKPTTWIYKVDQKAHNITFFDIGPDLIGERENHCCVVLRDHLYVIGGVYAGANTRFIEEWPIDIEMDADRNAFANFSNIDTLINTDIARSNLPQFGHRCVVNDEKQQIYVIGGITDEAEEYFNYSNYLFVLERTNDTLYEMNYRETDQEEEEDRRHGNVHYGKILPSLPMEMAYTAPMIDRYGYLNLFGGQLSSRRPTNKWYRINTKDPYAPEQQIDVIWKNHRKHNHNEQWALLILLIMVVLVGFWFKCISKMNRLRAGASYRNGGNYTDTAYDEITGTSEIDDLEDTEDIDNGPARHSLSDSDNDHQIYSHLRGIIASDPERQHNAQVVI